MQRRLLQKLNERFDQGDYYEAHQIYRTIYYRLIRENKYAEIYDLLFDGAVRLFEKQKQNSGADLANLLADTMAKIDSPTQLNHPENEVFQNIRLLFEKISPNSPERIEFVSKILKVPYISTSAIRKHFAEVLWKEKNYSDSRLHFIYSSDNGNNCALMLVEYQTQASYPYEVDLMIAQFVLQVLCIENQQLAHNAFYYYTLNHPKIRCTKPPFITPLLNFICFLFIAIDKYRGKSQVFNVLCQLYEKSLNRDPCYKEYLRQIGKIYFGVEKKTQHGGLFSNLIQSLFDMSDNGGEMMNPASNFFGHSTSSSSVSNTNQEVDLD